MTERLQQVLAKLGQLDPAQQDIIADLVEHKLEELEEQEWDAIVSKPNVRHALRRMAAAACEQEAKGETEEGGWEAE